MPSADLPHSKISYIALSEPGQSLHALDTQHNAQRVIAFGVRKNTDWRHYRNNEPGDASRIAGALHEHFKVDEYRTRHSDEFKELYVTRVPDDLPGMVEFLGGLHLRGLIAKDDMSGAMQQLGLPVSSLAKPQTQHSRLPERDEHAEAPTYHI